MEEQQNPLTYEIIKAAVAGEQWAAEKVFVFCRQEFFIQSCTMFQDSFSPSE